MTFLMAHVLRLAPKYNLMKRSAPCPFYNNARRTWRSGETGNASLDVFGCIPVASANICTSQEIASAQSPE